MAQEGNLVVAAWLDFEDRIPIAEPTCLAETEMLQWARLTFLSW
jgi:hypothetical protein